MYKSLLSIVFVFVLAVFMLTACAPKQEPIPPVELSNGSYEVDITELAIPAVKADFELLEGFTALETVDFSGSSCYKEIESFKAAHPDVTVTYTVKLPCGEVDSGITELDLSDLEHKDVKAYADALGNLTALRTVRLGAESEEREFDIYDTAELCEACPDVFFDFDFTLWGQEHNTADKELNYTHVKMDDSGEGVRTAMHCMPYCTYVDMDSCGVRDEDMAVIRDENPDAKVVWRVWFGSRYSVRTDVERILASKPSEGGNLEAYNTKSLKYCTEVKYIDLGHNETLGDISFIGYMPKLEVAVLAMTDARSIEGIQNCKNLEYLELQTNLWLDDISPLAELTNLHHLNIGYLFSVTDMSPIYNLTNLERLMIGPLTPVPPEQVEEFKRLVPDCEVDTETYDPTAGTWRYTAYNEDTYTYTLHPRYELLREQFGYSDPASFSFEWNDPLR